MKVWHGESCPCVSCGELARRIESRCPHCGQDLSLAMITKMQAHCGPWYVHEHVRPFPGVTLERLIRQIRRGVLMKTTIVRGPTTFHQWRFAAETPGLSKHLGVCWSCQAAVKPEDTYCAACDIHLDRVPGELPETAAPQADATSELDRLHQALRSAPAALDADVPHGRSLPIPLIIAAIIIATVGGVIAVVKLRESARKPAATPAAVQPAPPESTVLDATAPAASDSGAANPGAADLDASLPDASGE